MKSWFYRRLLVLASVILLPHSLRGAETSSGGLRIITPHDGAVFEPGQTVTVIVQAEGGISLKAVGVVTHGVVRGIFNPPFDINFAAPQALGSYKLDVTGKDEKGRSFDVELTYYVETATPASSIQVRPTRISFSSSWQEQLSVKGMFAEGQTRDVTKSRETRYISANPQIAKVSPEGLVEPVDNGTTTITITYKDKSVIVAVKVELKKLSILMDIKPEDPRNVVNLNSRGRLPVAIFSTKDFDASSIVPQTIRFGPKGASPLTMEEEDRDDRDDHGDRDDREDRDRREERRRTGRIQQHLEDINGDRLPDLLLFFRIQEIGFTCADNQAILTGFTLRGERISGSDTVQPIGPGCR